MGVALDVPGVPRTTALVCIDHKSLELVENLPFPVAICNCPVSLTQDSPYFYIRYSTFL